MIIDLITPLQYLDEAVYVQKSMYKNKNRQFGKLANSHALSTIYNSVTNSHRNHTGYDFTCDGFKIDVKTSSIHVHKVGSSTWQFNINKNTIPDFTLCIGFDNQINIKPICMWLFPQYLMRGESTLVITKSNFEYWSEYLKPIDSLIKHCAEICKYQSHGRKVT